MGFIKDNTNTFQVCLTDLGKQKFFDGGFKDAISFFSISDGDSNYDIFNPSLNEIIPFNDMGVINIGDVVSFDTIVRNNNNLDGDVDNTFNIGTGFTNTVRSMALQPDGKILAGGDFFSYSGVTRNGIIRLNTGGTIDNTFTIGTGFFHPFTQAGVYSVGLQPDGKILAGGVFTSYSGVTRNGIIRLNSNGTVDNTFNIGTGFTGGVGIPSPSAGTVITIALQPDGKILVGGDFFSYSGVTCNGIIRLNTGGTIDNTFNIGSGFNNLVYAIVPQPDGKILASGLFTSYSGVTSNRIIRLNSNGTIDNTFNIGTGFTGGVFAMTPQPDGKILMGGSFTAYGGVARNNIIRLNSNGTIDNTFNIGTGFNDVVVSIISQLDGKILISGNFTTYNGIYANKIIRLTSNGAIDNTFNIGTGFTGIVRSIISQSDGKILAGGDFASYSGVTRNGIIRLNNKFNNVIKYFRKIKEFNNYDEVPYFNTTSTINNEYWEEIFPFDSVNINPQPIQILNHNGVKKTSLPLSNIPLNPINVYFKHDQDTNFSITTNGTGNTLYQAFNPFISVSDYTKIDNVFRDNETLTINACSSSFFDAKDVTIKIYLDSGLLVDAIETNDGCVTLNKTLLNNNNYYISASKILFNSGFNNFVSTIALQPDGKILAGGDFTSYSGVTRNGIIRLNTGGTIDNTFNIGAGFTGGVTTLALQPDGKILVGGAFTSYSGVTRNRIVRLNSDGTIDNTFTIGSGFSGGFTGGVTTLALQPDGKILAGGDFTSYSGVTRNYIIRLNTGGTIDNTFNIGGGFNNFVNTIALQPDGKILAGGLFTSYSGTTRNKIIRLNSDGTIDNTFTIGTGFSGGVGPIIIPKPINTITPQPDGKILVGGNFDTYNGTTRSCIIRLNTGGTVDNTFIVGSGFNNFVKSIVIQPDGKILAGGVFTGYDSGLSNRIIRLTTGGTIDSTFDTNTTTDGFTTFGGFSDYVGTIALQADGKVLAGGDFVSYRLASINRIARLNSDGSNDNKFNVIDEEVNLPTNEVQINTINDIFTQTTLRGDIVDNKTYRYALFGVKNKTQKSYVLFEPDFNSNDTLSILTYLINE